ncbi:hypothetical protein KR018_000187, partial [Drosophila ironensis]
TSTLATTALCLALFLPLSLLQEQKQSDGKANKWRAQIELELQQQPDKLAYCRSLQIQQQAQQLDISLQDTPCAAILKQQLAMTGDMLIESQPRCWAGWKLVGKRCHRVA